MFPFYNLAEIDYSPTARYPNKMQTYGDISQKDLNIKGYSFFHL